MMLKTKTHKAIGFDKLMRMAADVEDEADEGKISAEVMSDLSADRGIPEEKLYAALGMSPTELALEHDVQVLVCTGGCQEYGALDCVKELLRTRDQRMDDGLPAYDVVPRHCLNRCMQAPIVEFRTPDGVGVLPDATPASVAGALEDVL
jgi:hypothetical protein